MAKDNIFQVEWGGIKELDELLNEMDDNIDRIILDEYTKFGKLAEEGTRALAPKDRGDMTDTINSDRAKLTGGGVVVELGANSPYAVYQHEKRLRKGKHPKYDRGAKFPNYYVNGYGARTRSKPAWRGKKPGRKYMSRAIQAIEPDYDEMNERILKRIMEGRR